MSFQTFDGFTTGEWQFLPSNNMSVSESLGLNFFGGESGIEGLSFQSEEDAQSWWDWIWSGIEKTAGGIVEVGTDILRSLPPIVIRTDSGQVQIPGTRPGNIPGTTLPRTGTNLPTNQASLTQSPGAGAGVFGGIDTSTLLIGGAVALGLIMIMSQQSRR